MTSPRHFLTRPLLAIALVACAPLSAGFGACTQGSGVTATRDHAPERFTFISVDYPATVEIEQAPKHALTITADDNVAPTIPWRVLNGTLYVGGETTASKTPPIIRISAPQLEGVHIKRALGVTISTLRGEQLELTVRTPDLISLSTDTHPRVVLKGQLGALEVDTRGEVWVDALECPVTRAEVKVVGKGTVDLSVSERLDGAMSSGEGRVRYTKKPKVLEVRAGQGATVSQLDPAVHQAELRAYLGQPEPKAIPDSLKEPGEGDASAKEGDKKGGDAKDDDKKADEGKSAVDAAMGY